jgi:hypothetical protein
MMQRQDDAMNLDGDLRRIPGLHHGPLRRAPAPVAKLNSAWKNTCSSREPDKMARDGSPAGPGKSLQSRASLSYSHATVSLQ